MDPHQRENAKTGKSSRKKKGRRGPTADYIEQRPCVLCPVVVVVVFVFSPPLFSLSHLFSVPNTDVQASYHTSRTFNLSAPLAISHTPHPHPYTRTFCSQAGPVPATLFLDAQNVSERCLHRGGGLP